MVNALNSAVTSGADGIAVSLIDPTAFNAPVSAALQAGIPVVAYNADAAGNGRLGYIGQDLMKAGELMGQRIKTLLPGGGDIAVFVATPGAANLQPRVNGITSVLNGTNIKPHVIATGAAQGGELTTIDAYWTGHQSTTKGLFAVDGGSTQAVAQVMQKYGLPSKGIKAGGFDLTPITQQLLAAKFIDFTIDQQPYLQGFLPIQQLYLYQVSQTLTGIADTDTGLKFLDSTTVKPYVSTKSRFEGTSTTPGVQKA
jgi:simple sugar transport system substrate-binding protein